MTVREAGPVQDECMETRTRTAPQSTGHTGRTGTSRLFRALTTGAVAAGFVLVMAFGAPDDNASRWEADIDAHSDISYEVAAELPSLGD